MLCGGLLLYLLSGLSLICGQGSHQDNLAAPLVSIINFVALFHSVNPFNRAQFADVTSLFML